VNQKQNSDRQKRDEEQRAIKSYKQQKHQTTLEDILDEEDMDEELYDYCRKHLK
jgi:hypothetical protein